MVAILQLAIQLYHQDLRLTNPEWDGIRQKFLMSLAWVVIRYPNCRTSFSSVTKRRIS